MSVHMHLLLHKNIYGGPPTPSKYHSLLTMQTGFNEVWSNVFCLWISLLGFWFFSKTIILMMISKKKNSGRNIMTDIWWKGMKTGFFFLILFGIHFMYRILLCILLTGNCMHICVCVLFDMLNFHLDMNVWVGDVFLLPKVFYWYKICMLEIFSKNVCALS